ncbi:hypothetical protein SLE2022_112970 [Rubroshorea leprosula]
MQIDQLKSATESNQMEMMTMMMDQIDKLPEIYGSYDGMSELPSPEVPDGATTGTGVDVDMAYFVDNPHVGLASPSFINQPTSTISFVGSTPVQEVSPSPPAFSYGRWRGAVDELPGASASSTTPSQKKNSMAAMREMIFRIAAMQPIYIDPESVKPPKRRNVKISKDPQSVAARHRRERISERIRILQRLVPGGTKMDTASMLDEAIHYVKFLKTQVQSLERAAANRPPPTTGTGFPVAMSSGNYLPILPKTYPTIPNDQRFGGA